MSSITSSSNNNSAAQAASLSDTATVPIALTQQALPPITLPQQQQHNNNNKPQEKAYDRTLYNQQQVELFLSQCGLTQYYETFNEEGFDRLESVSFFLV
jgi:hypothetical protein